MAERVLQWVAQSWEELRLIAPYAAAAFITGGSVSSVLVAFVWLLRRHPGAEPRT